MPEKLKQDTREEWRNVISDLAKAGFKFTATSRVATDIGECFTIEVHGRTRQPPKVLTKKGS